MLMGPFFVQKRKKNILKKITYVNDSSQSEVTLRLLGKTVLWRILLSKHNLYSKSLYISRAKMLFESRREPFLWNWIWNLGGFGPVCITENFGLGRKVCYFWGQFLFYFNGQVFLNIVAGAFKTCISLKVRKP